MSLGLTFGGRIALESVSPFVDHICKYFLQFFFSVREHEWKSFLVDTNFKVKRKEINEMKMIVIQMSITQLYLVTLGWLESSSVSWKTKL